MKTAEEYAKIAREANCQGDGFLDKCVRDFNLRDTAIRHFADGLVASFEEEIERAAQQGKRLVFFDNILDDYYMETIMDKDIFTEYKEMRLRLRDDSRFHITFPLLVKEIARQMSPLGFVVDMVIAHDEPDEEGYQFTRNLLRIQW